MYSHGLASIALCEAYAMTHDRELLKLAQSSLNFVQNAQDPVGGGWRYQPKQSGDMSVTAWQLMALKAGHMTDLRVSPKAVHLVTKFLDSVAVEEGSFYGYATPQKKPSTTAIGLLCRVYLGWKRDHPALKRGVEYLIETGPSDRKLYFNYYSTQVLFHYGGEPWKKWNDKIQNGLVDSQANDGHQAGSWFIASDHTSERGGRHLCTCLATLILETYYRYDNVYQTRVKEESFPE